MGLREAKKQKTRAAISQLATKLFIDRGYDAVTTAEIATLSDVSVPTLFKYFPTKEALVFDEDAERERFLVETVKNRHKGQTMLEALLDAGIQEMDEIENLHPKAAKSFMKLVKETPQLNLYAQQMWLRHEKSLAAVIRSESKRKVGLLEAEAIARFILDAYHRAIANPNPKQELKAMLKILKDGWKE